MKASGRSRPSRVGWGPRGCRPPRGSPRPRSTSASGPQDTILAPTLAEGGVAITKTTQAQQVVPQPAALWHTELELKSLSLAFAILYTMKLGRVGNRRSGYEADVRTSIRASSTASSAGGRRSAPAAAAARSSAAGERRTRASRRKSASAASTSKAANDELSVTREEMKQILDKRLVELEKEALEKKKKQEQEGDRVEDSEGDNAGAPSEAAAAASKPKFAFEDVSEPSQAEKASTFDKENYDKRREAIERERGERERAREQKEAEMAAARKKLTDVKEDLEASRQTPDDVPISPLDIVGQMQALSSDGRDQEGKAFTLKIDLPILDQSFSYERSEEESAAGFAARVAADLLRTKITDIEASVAGEGQAEESTQITPFGVRLTLSLQCLFIFNRVAARADACGSEDEGERFTLRVDPSLADAVGALESKYETCLGILSGEGKGEGSAKNAFLQTSLELMLSLDSALENTLSWEKLSLKRASFLPVFDSFFTHASALSDQSAAPGLQFLRIVTRDVLRTFLSLETSEGVEDFLRLSRAYQRNEAFGSILSRVERDLSLEEKRKRFASLRKSGGANKSEGTSPIPEKAWALRNVAGTLAIKSDSPQAILQAKQMYQESVRLKQEYLGSEDHPGLLEDLLPLAKMLGRERNAAAGGGEGAEDGGGMAPESVAAWERLGQIVWEVVEILESDGYPEYCVEIAMGVTMVLGEFLGPSSEMSRDWKEKSVTFLDALDEYQQEEVFSRLSSGGDILQDLAAVFSCDVESRQSAGDKKAVGRPAALKALECYEL